MIVEVENREVPFYYMCAFAMMHEQVKRMGSLSYLSLYPNVHMYNLPIYASNGDYLNPERTKKIIGNYVPYHSFQRIDFDNIEKGLAYLEEQLANGQLIIVQGTSYELPYHDDYHNPRYVEKLTESRSTLTITDHWLTVYGMEDGKVYLYDPVPFHYKDGVSVEEFERYWAGNKRIQAFQGVKGYDKLAHYGVVKVELEHIMTEEMVKPFFVKVLRTAASEFMRGFIYEERGNTYSFGRMASIQLKQDMEAAFPIDPNRLANLGKPLLDMRWARYYLRDLLNDMNQLFGQPYTTYAARFASFIQQWEELAKMYMRKANKKAFDEASFADFMVRLDGLMKEEDEFYQTILEEKADWQEADDELVKANAVSYDHRLS